MKMKNLFLSLFAALLLASCASSMSSFGGELTGSGVSSWVEPAPYGMVLVRQGSMAMGPAEADSLWGIMADQKGVSFASYWMDQTEVSNAKYRQFVHWVRDSIIRERLADPAYGGNDLFKITEDEYGEPVTPHLDWTRPIPWKKPNEDEQRAIESVYYTHPITGERGLDPRQMIFRYEWFDETSAALRKFSLDPAVRERNTDKMPKSQESILISKDTAFIDDMGVIVNETITRTLSGPYDFLHTRIVNIYPDETVWINDFPNAYNEPYLRNYFNHEGYNEYPVVGVSWEQATAFCVWRTAFLKQSLNLPAGMVIEPYRLPTEAEWEFAARVGDSKQTYPWTEESLRSAKGCFKANFKPGEGNYTSDGHLITSRCGSFSSNDNGLFDMAGNVAEWTATAYSESGQLITSDMNPDFRYDAAKEDPYSMKKKVIRGGSWKDVGTFIRSDMRESEFQNETRSYIGFRCVRTNIGFKK